MKTKTRKIIERIVNVILLIEFIILVAGGWICGLMANNKIAVFEKQYLEDMEELEQDLGDCFYSIDNRMEKLNDRITDLEEADIEEMQRYSKQILNELTIYEYILEAQHDLAIGKITQEKYQERINDLNNQWNELKGE